MKQNYQLFDSDTQAFIYWLQTAAVQRMLDFDYVCDRDTPSVSAIIDSSWWLHKAFFWEKEILIPIYKTIDEAINNHPNTDVMINFASFRSAYATSLEALEKPTIKVVVIIAEWVPERKARILIAEAEKRKKWIIGPATVWWIVAWQFKIWNAWWTIESIIDAKLNRPWSIWFISKSWWMSNEMYKVIWMKTDWIYEWIAIWWDAYPWSTFLNHIMRFEKNPKIKMIVLLGEVWWDEEINIAKLLKQWKIKKPLVAWVTWTCAKEFPWDVQFWHAWAKSWTDNESADAKNKALKNAWAIIPNSFNDFWDKIKETYDKLLLKWLIKQIPEKEWKQIPDDFEKALKEKKIRKWTDLICSISCDTWEEATYYWEPISKIVENETLGIWYVIWLLWFKKKLPSFACKYIEMIVKTVADHGPCVAWAHNAIVTARAWKDLMSALATWILTIGPRFGWAIDWAAYYFKDAFDRGLSPNDFVKEMKKKWIKIPWIWHKIKSTKNPDKRVESLKKFIKENFKNSNILSYALEVEKLTTGKKANLILNVDGCIWVSFVDMMKSMPKLFTEDEINKSIQIWCLNGLFVLGRSIWIMGHYFDQVRLGQGLYRYPTRDVCYLTKWETN